MQHFDHLLRGQRQPILLFREVQTSIRKHYVKREERRRLLKHVVMWTTGKTNIVERTSPKTIIKKIQTLMLFVGWRF